VDGGDPLGQQPTSAEASAPAAASEASTAHEAATSADEASVGQSAEPEQLMSTYAHRRANWTSMQQIELRRWRTGRTYRRWRDKVLAPSVLICCRCGRLIDKSLHWRHPMAPTADHYPIALSRWVPRGPHDEPLGAPAHRVCNLRAQNRMVGDPLPRAAVADRRW
jgi:hypothetical protein